MKIFYTSGKCPKCGRQLLTSDVKGYGFVCKKCDENFYTLEIKENMADFYEINIVMTSDTFDNKLNVLRDICDKYECDFLGHDDECGFTDFGWKNGFPDSETINNFVNDIESILD